jgi:hypothetical protein
MLKDKNHVKYSKEKNNLLPILIDLYLYLFLKRKTQTRIPNKIKFSILKLLQIKKNQVLKYN